MDNLQEMFEYEYYKKELLKEKKQKVEDEDYEDYEEYYNDIDTIIDFYSMFW